jgi:hypothetical protein
MPSVPRDVQSYKFLVAWIRSSHIDCEREIARASQMPDQYTLLLSFQQSAILLYRLQDMSISLTKSTARLGFDVSI